ncbi:uncharacterized protein FIBRA_04983 [Fibroporia radiculosa]|uniref:PIN domain-containing protein n=1 Tax=Fibroporia radiculosa TaxID=599839 RepID=J4GQ67_9APHY|nr:uncharacterized protein FIBRA_04983 [Fibroporia radiculosa]CCM02870.1 predicted protein [Fibroporia radiculosa]
MSLGRQTVRLGRTLLHTRVRFSTACVARAAHDSPLKADNQKNTGGLPSYGPVGVAAALAEPPSPTPASTLFAHEFSLADRVALVTGGNRGLGLEMAMALAEAGARAVYCVDLPKAPGEEWTKVREHLARMHGGAARGRLEYVSGDVRNQEEMWKIGEKIGDTEGRMDACVAAAGVLKANTDCLEYPAKQFQDVMDVNVNGVLFAAQAAGRQMARFGNGGSIVLIASMSGSITNKDHAWVSYNTSKSAVLQMTRSMACELGPKRIRVNSLSPGHIYTRPPPPPRKPRDRDPAQPTDLVDKIVALQRRQAAATKPRDRPDRPPAVSPSRPPRPSSPRRLHAPPLPNPNIVVSHPTTMEADPDDFSRRLRISANSPRSSHSKPVPGPSSVSPKRLYNPDADHSRRHILTAEPDTISDATSSSYAPRASVPHGPRPHHHPQISQSRAAADSHRQLFDYRKDDPVRFSVLSRPHPSSASGTNGSTTARPTPTPKSSGDYVSASSTSSASYAQSTLSSSFTLSSNTTDSSTPSALFENPNGHARRSEDSASNTNAFSMQLKKLYRTISALEAKILGEDRDNDQEDDGDREPRVGILLKGRPGSATETKAGEDEAERWRKLMTDHKDLAEMMQKLLTMTLAPSVPASLRNIPTKYNLIIRLWTHAFHRLLELLRRAASPPNTSVIALEYLQDFIYYAYTFYTGLLEERNLQDFRSGWIQALGDLARYRMAICGLVESIQMQNGPLMAATLPPASAPTTTAQLDTLRSASISANSDHAGTKPVSATPAARIDDSPPSSHVEQALQQGVPSVGLAAARLMELEPEKERWRQIARDWFARGLALAPGTGKLQHYLGLLSREKEGPGEELRSVYHFVKSMIAIHPFTTSRESILQLWSPSAQMRRQAPDADLTELFVLLHGMLFTNIQLDDFRVVLDRFEEKLYIEEGAVVEERDWIMMATVNLAVILEYGRPTAALRRVAGIAGVGKPGSSPAVSTAPAGKVRLMAKRTEEDEKTMDVDGDEADTEGDPKSNGMVVSPIVPEQAALPAGPELPQGLKLGMQLAFSILAHALQKPMRRSSPFAHSTLNPYLTIFLTFLATVIKDGHALSVLERAIPWNDLAKFLNSAPRRLMFQEYQKERGDGPPLLTSGCKPLPEDWCLRGMGWGGKRVYPMGFWGKEAGAEERTVELDVLDKVEGGDQLDGIIEDGDDDDSHADAQHNELAKRWVRVARAGLKIAKHVHGFEYVPPANEEGRGQWKVEGVLAAKVARWREEERREREEEERRLRGRRWDEDLMDVDDDASLDAEASSDDSEDDEGDTAEVRALKARRRYLKGLLQSSRRGGPSLSASRRRPRGSRPTRPSNARSSLCMVAGYTILVIDTNILLSSLSMFSSLVESLRWTVVVPLPVIMELDGLANNPTPLGDAATSALSFITSHIRSHSASLKVQTSRGNYLSNLNVRTEQVELTGDEASWERNMDDLILRAAIWQDEHWADRSGLLQSTDAPRDTAGAAKVVLLSFDRMCKSSRSRTKRS